MSENPIMSALEGKIKDIQEVFDSFVKRIPSCDEKYHKTNNALIKHSDQNIAIAYTEDLLPGTYPNYVFASSAFGQIESADKNLIDELTKIDTSICTMEEKFCYTYQRLNEDLEFEEALAKGFPNRNPNCCERSIVEYVSKIHRKEIEKIYINGGQASCFSDFKKNDLVERTGLTGSLYIFTLFEPCLYCYSLLKKLKKDNPYLTLKVYYPQMDYTGKTVYDIIQSMEEESKRRKLINKITKEIKESTHLQKQETKEILGKVRSKNNSFTSKSLEQILELINTNNSKEIIINALENLKEK